MGRGLLRRAAEDRSCRSAVLGGPRRRAFRTPPARTQGLGRRRPCPGPAAQAVPATLGRSASVAVRVAVAIAIAVPVAVPHPDLVQDDAGDVGVTLLELLERLGQRTALGDAG